MKIDIQDSLKQRILVLDGAMGTMIQTYHLSEEDYRGRIFKDSERDLKGNNELLSLTRPDVIEAIHSAYCEAGADILETNTFNANGISQQDYQTHDSIEEMNLAAAGIARKVTAGFTQRNPQKPRFVCGVLGPTNRTASISPDVNRPAYRNITFQDLVKAYSEQTRALLKGGVDLLMIETVFDTLNGRAALVAVQQVFDESGKSVPLMVSGTIPDASGRTLSGQTIEAFWLSVKHANLLSVGLNCALGADQLRPHIGELSRFANTCVSLHPNAGLPNEFGEYDDTPEFMGGIIREFAVEGLLNIVGGCCGTTAEHIRVIGKAVEDISPRRIPEEPEGTRLSGLEPLTIRSDSLFVNVGERTNVAGSAKFRKLIEQEKYEEALIIARDQIRNGAQILDINMDAALLDSEAVMETFLRLIASEPEIGRVPIMIDSSKWSVIETGLQNIQGKGIVNSISLKEGEDMFIQQARKIHQYGAAIVVMAFDEEGQADTVERKVEICSRSYKLLTETVGFPAEDIILDPNIFAVATGMAEHNEYAVNYIEACRIIKQTLPGVLVSGGVSNLSFSFRGNNAIREAMHSAFLFHAIQAGMDMGIVNAGQLTVYDDIPEELRTGVEDVLFNRHAGATDRLLALAEDYKGVKREKVQDLEWRKGTVEERITHAMVEGIQDHIVEDVMEAGKSFALSLDIIEGPLMAGMSRVGDLFGAGRMFLPQVVKSARVMKKAVEYLEPLIAKENRESGKQVARKKILLATVKGDVHDIGKNIVGVVLRCNNYDVIDLGVMVPASEIVDRAIKESVDIIGLSGLITPSLDEMVNVAREMERKRLDVPLLIGGATTSRTHTAVKIAPSYSAPAIHVIDASRGVSVAATLFNQSKREDFTKSVLKEYSQLRESYNSRKKFRDLLPIQSAREQALPLDWTNHPINEPALKEIKVFDDYPLRNLVGFIDWTPLFDVWELKGRYPEILDDEQKGDQARKLIQDAREILDVIIREKSLTARAVMGIFPANSIGDDIEIYSTESRDGLLSVVHNLRQQFRKGKGRPNRCLSDYIAPRKSKHPDWLGVFAVSAGFGSRKLVEAFEKEHDDYSAIMVKALADRLAEAFAEHLHQRVRMEFWGYAIEENLENNALIREEYQGIRPAPGYPACPDHTEKEILFDLLDVEKNIGISLTENYAMIPAASVSGWYFSHPEAAYFGVGKIGKDQVIDYAARKGMDIKAMERWLSVNLAYDPEI